jgi:hypothetical protein
VRESVSSICDTNLARLSCFLVCVAFMAPAARVEAQQPPSDPVAEAPFHLGVAGVAPAFAVTNLGVDTNVFNSRIDPKKDFTFTATPSARLWLRTQRGLLSVDGRVDLVYFATYSSERSANRAGTIRYEYPFARVRPFVSYNMLNTRERPGYEIDSRARRYEDGLRLGAIVPIGSVTTLEFTRRRERVNFNEEEMYGGQPLYQTLDRKLDAWDAIWRQPLTVLTTWVVRGAHERERFEYEPNRNSDSLRVSSGFDLSLLALVRGTALVGYRRLTPADGGTLARFSGLTAEVDVSYTAPSQTRVQTLVNRDLHYSFEQEQPYYVQTGWTLTGTQRLVGRWDVQVTGGRDHLAYRSVDQGNGRNDLISRIGGGIGYDLGDDVRMGFDMLLQLRQSPLPSLDYRSLKWGVSMTYGY